jgi:predicted transcriptional regulator of viral defense system
VVLSFQEQGRTVVRAADVLKLLGSETTARKVIRNLIRKGWLSRIVGGRYMLLPSEHGPENLGENNLLALAAAAVEPSYIGWWSAAAWHGFTTQKPMTVFVATLKQVPSRTIEGGDVRFIKVTQRKFFDFQRYDVYGREVPISTPAKTLADCLDRPELAGGPPELARIVHSALGKLNAHEVFAAVTAMKSKALLQRLGFLSDLVGRPLPDDVGHSLREAIPKSYRSQFGRAGRRKGDVGYVSAWGLLVNAHREDLLAEVPHKRERSH